MAWHTVGKSMSAIAWDTKFRFMRSFHRAAGGVCTVVGFLQRKQSKRLRQQCDAFTLYIASHTLILHERAL